MNCQDVKSGILILGDIDLPSGYAGLFSNRELSGKDWLSKLPPEDKAVFSYIGRMHNQHGRLGGLARAATAKRDEYGRFRKG